MKLKQNEIIGLVLVAVGLIALVLLLPGLVGGPGPAPLRVLFGWGAVIVVLAFILSGLALFLSNRMGWEIRWLTIAGGELMFLALVTAAHLAARDPQTTALAGNGGGLLGWAARDALRSVMPQRAAWAVTILIFGAGFVLLWLGLPERWTDAVQLRVLATSRRSAPVVGSPCPTRASRTMRWKRCGRPRRRFAEQCSIEPC